MTLKKGVMILPSMSSSKFWNKASFEDRPTNKLGYFWYATANGEKMQGSQ